MHSMVQVSYFSRLSYQFYVSFFFPACIHIVSKFILKTAGISQSIYGGHIWPAVFRCRLLQVSLTCSISLSLQGVLIPLIPIKFLMVEPDQRPCPAIIFICFTLRFGQINTQRPPAGPPVAYAPLISEMLLPQILFLSTISYDASFIQLKISCQL